MQIEYAIVADHAEITGNRLFLMGGGRDVFAVETLPSTARIAFAIGVRIAWEETNEPHKVRIVAEDDDGKELVRIEAAFNAGRPPGLAPGSGQLAQMASLMHLPVDREGGYRVRVSTGEDERRVEQAVPFRIIKRKAAAPPNP